MVELRDMQQHVCDDWPTVVLSGLERCIEKRVEYEKAKDYLDMFGNACARKNVYDVEDEEFSGRLWSLHQASCSLLLCDDRGSARVCIEILQSYMTYGRDSDVVSSFEEVSSACLSFLKGRKGCGEPDTEGVVAAGWELLERCMVRMHSLSDDMQTKRGASAMVSKVGGLCVNMFDVDAPCVKLLGCLGACLIGFPASLKHVEKGLEEKIGAVLMRSGPCQHAAAVVFAMLPRISGSGDAWSRCSQRLLVSIHSLLDTLTDGLKTVGKDESLHIDVGEAPLLVVDTDKSQMILFSEYIDSLLGLMDSLTCLITNTFQVPVPMPILGVISLYRRMMRIDVTRIRSIERVGRTAGQVALLGIHVSSLQFHVLHMLSKLMNTCQGGIIIPHMYSINMVLTGYLETVSTLWAHDADISDEGVFRQVLRCVAESIRIDGIAGTQAFSELIMRFATSTISPYLKSDQEELLLTKVSAKTYFARHEYAGRMLLSAMECHAAILHVIESIFMHGSSVLKCDERLFMEDFVLHVASSSYQLVEHTSLHTKGDITRISIVLSAALKALAAVITAPSVYRPSHAAEALMLFRKAASLSTLDIRSVSLTAISHLEAFMHPKSLAVGTAVGNIDSRARNKHGMPSFWSFLEYDGTNKQGRDHESQNPPKATEEEPERLPPKRQTKKELPEEPLKTEKRTLEEPLAPAPKKHIQENTIHPATNIEFKIRKFQPIRAEEKLQHSLGNNSPLVSQEVDNVDSDSDPLPEIDSGDERS